MDEAYIARLRPATGSSVPPPSILVVESHAGTALDLTQALRALCYNPLITFDAMGAILALDDRIDLLFTAIAMPKFDGFMLADMAKSHRPRISIVYTTDDFESASKLMRAAGQVHGPVLKQPYTKEELENAIVDAFAYSDIRQSRTKRRG